MKMKKILALGLAIVMTCGLFLTGCGGNEGPNNEVSEQEIAKKGIQVENYLELYTDGYDGYAKLYADLDIARLKEDCSKFLVDETVELPFARPGCEVPADYLDYYFDGKDAYNFVRCENPQNLSNGDKVEVAVQLPYELASLLTVEVEEETIISYNVKGLEKFEGIDPFKFANFTWRDLVSTGSENGYDLGYASTLILLPDGTSTQITLGADLEEGKIYTRADKVRVYVKDEMVAQYEERYGEGIFKSTEFELPVDRIGYLPTGDNAKDVFEYMDEKCLDNVDYATKKMADSVTDTDTTVERIGMMFFYDNEGTLEKSDRPYKFYNQLVFVYKITNDVNPDGWYTYMAYNGYVAVGYQLNKGTIELEKCVGDIYGSHLMDDFRYFQNEHPKMSKGEFPSSFEYAEKEYPGHIALADVFKAIEQNMEGYAEYDHLIVTDGLKDYVKGY